MNAKSFALYLESNVNIEAIIKLSGLLKMWLQIG